MEYIDVVDENNELTDIVVSKEEVHDKGLWYREVVGFVINQNGEILLQKRSPHKREKANLWEVCYGHVSSKEEPQDSMLRELQEEIGLEVKKEDLQFLRIEKIQEHNENHTRFHYAFSYIFLIRTDKKITDYVLQEDEVSDVKYVKIEEIRDMYISNDKNLALNNLQYLLELLDQIEGIYNGKEK